MLCSLSLPPDLTISTILLPPSFSLSTSVPSSLSPSFSHPLTAIRWHLSQSDVDDVAVYIPMSLINDDGGNFLTVLKAIPYDEVLRKQAAIRRIGE
jgi:hypothetical protein